MGRASKLGMACHQALGFSPLACAIPKARAVFWPGCALLNLEPAILEKTLAVLGRAEPHIRLASACCGQPSVYLFPDRAEARKRALARRLKAQGVCRIYTACPNCTLELAKLEGAEVRSLWPMLADCLTAGDLTPLRGDFIWHDPCPTRADGGQQEACRRLLALTGGEVSQPPHTGPRTLCCGSFRMLQATDPEKSAAMRRKRLAELPEDRIIVSSCEGCLNAFRGEGRSTLHLLELLFGKSGSRGWGNRFKTTQKAKR